MFWRLVVAGLILLTSACERGSAAAPTYGLLPGQEVWPGDVSSYLFGTNNTQSWDLEDNIDTDPHGVIQASLRDAGFTLLRTFLFAHSLYDGHATTDQEIDRRMRTVQNTGMQCLGTIKEIDTAYGVEWAKRVVAYLGDRCNLYEIGNEPDLDGITPERYLQIWNSLVPQLRQINPNAKFIGPVVYNNQGNFCTYTPASSDCYMRKFLRGVKASGVLPDAVSFHWYPCFNDTAGSCLSKASTYADVTREVKGWVRELLGQDLPVGITEWNMDPGSNTALANDAAFMASFTKNALAAMVAAKLDFANQFDTQNYGGYGTLDMFDIGNVDQPKAQFYAIRDTIALYRPAGR
jgi:hypothetical protein